MRLPNADPEAFEHGVGAVMGIDGSTNRPSSRVSIGPQYKPAANLVFASEPALRSMEFPGAAGGIQQPVASFEALQDRPTDRLENIRSQFNIII